MDKQQFSEFQRLCDRRELAALNCVNAIQFVLAFFEAQDFARAREVLEDALLQHKQADDAVSQFHLQLKKENSAHGNQRSIA